MSLDWSEQPASPSLGQTLRFQREQLGWSLEAASARIKYSARQIQALEEDRYADLPRGVTLRGMVRNYARAVGLPHEPLLILLEAEISTQPEPVLTEHGRPLGAMPHDSLKAREANLALAAAPTSSRWPWWLLLVCVVIVAVAFAVRPDWRALLPFWADQLVAEELSSVESSLVQSEVPQSFAVPAEPVTPQPGAGPVAEAAGVAAPAAVADNEAAPVPMEEAQPTEESGSEQPQVSAGAPLEAAQRAAESGPLVTQTPSAVTASPEATADTVTPTAEATPVDGLPSRLLLRASADSWVELRDMAGRVLFSRVLRAGEEFQSDLISANLVIGNAAGMEVVWQGQTLDLSAVQRSNVARLSLE